LLGLAFPGKIENPLPERREILDGRCRSLEIIEIGVRNISEGSTKTAATPGMRFSNPHQLVMVGVGKRPQQNSVDHAENRRARADAEGECEDNSAREAGRLAKCAYSKTQILPAGFDKGFPAARANDFPADFEASSF